MAIAAAITAVAIDTADGLELVRQGWHHPILALTPAARATLIQAGFQVFGTEHIYSDAMQKEVVGRIVSAREKWDNVLSRMKFSNAARHMLRVDSTRIMATALAIEAIISSRDKWFVRCEERWEVLESKPAIINALLPRLIGSKRNILHNCRRPWLAQITGCLTRIALRFHSPGLVPIALNSLSRNFAALARAMVTHNRKVHLWAFEPDSGTRSGFMVALKVLFGLTQRQTVLPVPVYLEPRLAAKLDAELNQIPSNLWAPISACRRLMVENAVAAQVYSDALRHYLALLRPVRTILWDIGNFKTQAFAEHSKQMGTEIVVVPHAPSTSDVAGDMTHAVSEFVHNMMGAPPGSIICTQTPVADRLIARARPDLAGVATQPIAYADAAKVLPAKTTGRPRFLHAGNYFGWSNHVPWSQETADEFIAGLARLVEAMRELSDIDLVIRVKDNWDRKGECGPSHLKALLPLPENVTIRTGGTFIEDLSSVCCLISFASSTIEEALLAGRPVLLHGASSRYRYRAARLQPPSIQNRAAVYAVDDASDLVAMLRSIAIAHHGRLLTDAERSPYLWPSDIPGLDRVAAWLSDPRFGQRPA